MKTTLCLTIAATAFLAGCGEKPANNPAPAGTNTSSGNPITAPVDYLGAVGQAQKTAIKTIDVSVLNNAINSYSAAEGRFPKDLKELIPEFIREIPKAPIGQKLVYDSQTGKVTVQNN